MVTVGRPPILPAAACRPRGGLQVPGRESEGGPMSTLRLREESTPLALLVVLLARAAVFLTFSLLPGLRGVVRDVMDGAGIGMDRSLVMVSLLGRSGGSWHADSWGWGSLAPGQAGVVLEGGRVSSGVAVAGVVCGLGVVAWRGDEWPCPWGVGGDCVGGVAGSGRGFSWASSWGIRDGGDLLEALLGRGGNVRGGVEKEDLMKTQPWLE
jgi:hypothetical protein